MIALAASVLIAALDVRDAHHAAAAALPETHADRPFVIGPVNRAEILISPTRAGQLEEFVGALTAMGVVEPSFPADASMRLAELRVATGQRIPDCCVLLTAQQSGAAVASFDGRLRSAARDLGLAVLPDDEDPGVEV
ncbi:type II toxin-antitoxin system VapC family toxin [Nocardioides sp. SLBN-35]|uniref:type II toxin-antitoxin system VapC family toxin n=1 Tax=Nocardioides sp. SLBN-35 TaxID=2768445 RepID=UPI00116811DC|nr:type II toxin-antitoxin system VapC family toxin [Nocardioides sp. SLBN-35]TQK72213.1 PIN domain-containing protein [Nocardioides sp. SLBN-35]